MVSPIKVFVDSSLFIEYIKGNKTELLEKLFASELDLCINSTVLSELLYHYLGCYGRKSPRALKENKSIHQVFTQNNPQELIDELTLIAENDSLKEQTIEAMKKYNLLSNDAIILVDCKNNQINYVASYDPDFKGFCEDENINLISDDLVFDKYFP